MQHLSSETEDPLVFDEFRLIGRLIGLAIYNSVILDIRFPLALYKKLMRDTVGFNEGINQNNEDFLTLEDLKELDPMLGRGMHSLLTFEPKELVEDTFDRCFEVEIECFGEKICKEIVPGGKDIKLTHENRQGSCKVLVSWDSFTHA
jgi:ubiquitin-protein ligase E3 A